MPDPFGSVAEEYDSWYDSAEGTAVLAAESACLRLLVPRIEGTWLEVGAGTGRFSAALGVGTGLDPSPSMLAIAARRGIKTLVATGERLPFAERSLDGILMVATLCFVENAPLVLSECVHVLRSFGVLLIGHIPSDGPWGQVYLRKAREGHPLYSRARFTTVAELAQMATAAGLTLQEAASTLFWPPGGTPESPPRIEHGESAKAGFTGLLFTVAGSESLHSAIPTREA